MPPTNPNRMLRLTPLGHGRYVVSHAAPPADVRPEPALPDLDADYARAVAPWRAAGAPVATAHTYQARRATCAKCPWLAPHPAPLRIPQTPLRQAKTLADRREMPAKKLARPTPKDSPARRLTARR
ncbi:MAG: hypothetical protein LBK60_00565 [Verrucomicrobiales bacterium]|jgi:hypothetical protein|nr:hypothetical protein [Verrucomicrobiales bacterium]